MDPFRLVLIVLELIFDPGILFIEVQHCMYGFICKQLLFYITVGKKSHKILQICPERKRRRKYHH